MIELIAIASTALSVFSDEEPENDLGALLERAILVGDPNLFLSYAFPDEQDPTERRFKLRQALLAVARTWLQAATSLSDLEARLRFFLDLLYAYNSDYYKSGAETKYELLTRDVLPPQIYRLGHFDETKDRKETSVRPLPVRRIGQEFLPLFSKRPLAKIDTEDIGYLIKEKSQTLRDFVDFLNNVVLPENGILVSGRSPIYTGLVMSWDDEEALVLHNADDPDRILTRMPLFSKSHSWDSGALTEKEIGRYLERTMKALS